MGQLYSVLIECLTRNENDKDDDVQIHNDFECCNCDCSKEYYLDDDPFLFNG